MKDVHRSRFPCVDTVKLLLKCGASLSVMDADRNTPLHTLCSTVSIIMTLTSTQSSYFLRVLVISIVLLRG